MVGRLGSMLEGRDMRERAGEHAGRGPGSMLERAVEPTGEDQRACWGEGCEHGRGRVTCWEGGAWGHAGRVAGEHAGRGPGSLLGED